ncbi:DUF736 family protein [Methylobacterium indicum]|uniref:DUF736 domain-containing protein n=1 Tax=Methylobacterium indicum TaxID=1775910 RepID=A0ABR5H6I7_9HYPH|nr:DUF736 family protein [Methylobacterium indicum]KMO17527.1 hypothetical protein QR78_17320 [Methylobacterium indicum]KMO19873.1 hypothetical protein QR79_19125 [Methylobacterium indicum]
MALIGTFLRGSDGSFTGTVRTATLLLPVEIRLDPGRRPTGPDYRVVTASEAEFGFGWHTPHQRLGWFVRLILDDVTFPCAIQASLVADPVGQERFRLLWSR